MLTALIHANAEEKLPVEKTVDVDDVLSDIVMTLLFAGFDTTSITLTYVLYIMATHPEIRATCVREIDALGPHADVDDFVYCHAVLLETLRLYPPAFSTERTLQKSVTLPDRNGNGKDLCFIVPAGTMVVCPIWMMHRAEHNFTRALEFLPERWATPTHDGKDGHREPRVHHPENTNPDTKGIPAANPEALFTFSSGGRGCPGRKFALTEALLIMTHLLRDFDFALADPDYVLKPVRNGVVQNPQGGVPLKITLRAEKVKKKV